MSRRLCVASRAHSELVQARAVVEFLVTLMRVMVTAAVGTLLGLVRCLHGLDPGSQLFEHGLEHVIIGQGIQPLSISGPDSANYTNYRGCIWT